MNMQLSVLIGQRARFIIKCTIVLLVLSGTLSPALTSLLDQPSACFVTIENDLFPLPGCEEFPDPSSPGLGI